MSVITKIVVLLLSTPILGRVAQWQNATTPPGLVCCSRWPHCAARSLSRQHTVQPKVIVWPLTLILSSCMAQQKHIYIRAESILYSQACCEDDIIHNHEYSSRTMRQSHVNVNEALLDSPTNAHRGLPPLIVALGRIAQPKDSRIPLNSEQIDDTDIVRNSAFMASWST